MPTYLIGVDIGTSACKVALFDVSGNVIAQSSAAYSVYYPKAGWAEQNPDDWWQGVCSATKQLITNSRISADDVAGIGVDGQSWATVLLDKQGKVLCPAPIWTDTRSSDITEAHSHLEAVLFQCSGNPFKPSYALPKILWFKKHRPEIYQRIGMVLQSNSYIVYRMTGEMTQDPSQGYGYACFDMRKGRWNLDLCRELGIASDILPTIVPCHQVVGRLTLEAARNMGLQQGIPVVAGGLDAACGTLGAGVLQPGETQEQGGQAGGMSLCLDTYTADPHLILGCHVVPDRWLLQGGTTGGGGALKWLRETICPELSFSEMSELAEQVPPGSEGVIFLPYMAGERSPVWDEKASGVFFGLNYAKSRGHLIRSCMEGVAFALLHNLDTARAAGAEFTTLRAVGGSALSMVWTQIKADVTGCTMLVPESDTATALGAAILAGIGTGVYSDFYAAVHQTVTIKRKHIPDPSTVEAYAKGYQVYRELYPRLHDLMR